ncbi:3-phosphoserine/phosphohydroxythreonine transaminase [Edaphocola aurantiacus]|uniref:3-phosphoserine/phosphohydroxythreonine transaminase n=1 Tax=Edaphocola aurantiacus TaxID=2601682 RepID=UPI001C9821E3|nr:3-phosphoserine/phosphohydroxythreonine transaminase [Edaphocola aurantiacus]
MKLNFNAGPAALPGEVLETASRSVLEYKDSGMSILSLPHRGPHFKAILEDARKHVLQLLGLSEEEYAVMWFQGGGRLQFEMIPMNFLPDGATAAYIDSGRWAADAMSNAERYGKVHIAASSREDDYKQVPTTWNIPDDAAYLHLTANNTIYGTQSFTFPDTDVPVIADFSSELFSRKLDYSRFAMIYAVAQKNIGPSGTTLVIARKDFIQQTVKELPEILSYKAMAEKNSLVNTAPVFSIYVSSLYLGWMAAKGMDAIEQESIAKSQLLYNYIDQSSLYYTVAAPDSRSRMNVCCRLRREELTDALVAFAAERGILGIGGHRNIGGLRISIYNAISLQDTEQLLAVLKEFEQMHA